MRERKWDLSCDSVRRAGWAPSGRGPAGLWLPPESSGSATAVAPRGGDPGDTEETRHGCGADSGPAGGWRGARAGAGALRSRRQARSGGLRSGGGDCVASQRGSGTEGGEVSRVWAAWVIADLTIAPGPASVCSVRVSLPPRSSPAPGATPST